MRYNWHTITAHIQGVQFERFSYIYVHEPVTIIKNIISIPLTKFPCVKYIPLAQCLRNHEVFPIWLLENRTLLGFFVSTFHPLGWVLPGPQVVSSHCSWLGESNPLWTVGCLSVKLPSPHQGSMRIRAGSQAPSRPPRPTPSHCATQSLLGVCWVVPGCCGQCFSPRDHSLVLSDGQCPENLF